MQSDVRNRGPSQILAAWLAVIGACVLLLGLPRLLVLCSHGEAGRYRVEFAHAPGACCHDDHTGPDARGCVPRPAGLPAVAPDRRCEHSSLASELAPPERKPVSHPDGATPTASIEPMPACREEPPARARLPQATGPPRPAPHLRLRATTLLLL